MDRNGKLIGDSETSEPNQAGEGDVFGLKFGLPSGDVRLFTELPISIGRAADNDLVIEYESVSSHHAQIYFDEIVSDVCILDLDSFNGLLIDGLPTRKNVLHDGVKIGLGGTTITFRDTGYIHQGQ